MSNEEEKKCPLCAEEMDWTDQQFMPCKCGYQICVWCWHHIIDMAEKDAAEGRCPACRTIYEKEKIVAMQANCERSMSKVSNRKTKQPKAKPKANEVKKDLTNIRVIQRKMAYVIGLPLSLANEDVLLRNDYFGQYGKVTKVSLSRTAGGAIQQFVNDTCSVYITYAKEEEALRCIQSVHGFVLEGRFLRASFGTAKYCHAWLKNMPCNNPACLYLHSIGADEDSFGKDEVAAVHTRSRVQQIVGAANNVIKRSGTVLPPPLDDVHTNSSSFSDKSTTRSSISDGAHGSGDSTSDVHPCKDKEGQGPIALPQKMSSFVDIVGRSSSAAPEKDGTNSEDRRILDLCSELSSIAVGGEMHAEAPYSVPSLFKIPSSDHVANGFINSAEKPPGGDSLSHSHRYKSTCGSSHGASFLHPFCTSHVLEDSGGAALHRKAPSLTGFTLDHNPVNIEDDEASLPIRCVNSISNDSCQEMKFQNSAKSDRIYRSSQSFSNEEIVEHLRRIDNDNLHNDDENSVSDAVKSSIISNIMSIDFDSCEDSLGMPNGLSGLLDEADVLGGSSWSSLNSDQSGYSFAKQDGFVSQVAASILPEYRDIKEPYLCKPQYPGNRSHSLAPPGFTMPSRDPPPGFSNCDRTGCLPRPSSGGRLANTCSFSSTLFQPSTGFDDAGFFDPAMSPSGKVNQTNGFQNTMFEARPSGTHGLNAFEDESRFWLMMQQSASACQDSNFSQIFAPQIPLSQSFAGGQNGMTGLNDVYGLSSRLADENQNHGPSFFTQMEKQKYANGHGSNSNGFDGLQHKGESGLTEVQRNERFGANYFSGYGGDLMFSSGDVYTKVFGL
ncbi:RING-type E3 ubiquitin transferase [Salvia divinorum]|uniref:RING-type E3 ubiquitin transferase n=1 Tax=Salvia divinorum TaxID=28513 RepID=A0ABD1FNZ5_SALDI